MQQASKVKQESEPSDIDSGLLSKTTSTCSSHSESELSSASRSVTPVRLRTTSPALQNPNSVSSPLLAEQIVSDQQSDLLSPSQIDSQINHESIPMASSDQGTLGKLPSLTVTAWFTSEPNCVRIKLRFKHFLISHGI